MVTKLSDAERRNAELIVARAKIKMLDSHPFYAHILTHLRIKLVEGLNVNGQEPISATDGRVVYIEPTRYLALDKAQQLSVLYHEQMHCLDGHLWRKGARDASWANVAQDIYIYHIGQNEGFATLRRNEQVLSEILATQCSTKWSLDDFKGMFWEQIYEIIAPPPQPSGGSGDDGDDDGTQDGAQSPQFGGCYHPQPASGSGDGGTREEWQQWVREAGIYAKVAGSKPGHWQEMVEAATPKVPFETRFYEYLKRGLGGDQTYDAFSRRHIARGMYLPNDVVEVMGETVLVNDTSGSRTKEDLGYAYGVFKAWRELHPCKCHVVDADTRIAKRREFEEWDELPAAFEAHGRGGTKFGPVFVELEEAKVEPTLCIFFTDGYNFDELSDIPAPSYPVLWVLSGAYKRDFAPPFGEVCPVERPDA